MDSSITGNTVINIANGGITAAGTSYFPAINCNNANAGWAVYAQGGGGGVFNMGGNSAVWANNGGMTASAFNSSSDERLKENIVPAHIDGLAAIRAVELIEYDRPDLIDPTKSTHVAVGFSAQQLQKIMPEVVVNIPNPIQPPPPAPATWDEEYLAISLLPLIGFLTDAVQRMAAELDEIKARLV
jgi:hypothetical protein